MRVSAIALLAAYICFAAWMYARANERFRHHPKLPMQWALNRQPTWYAPRRVALTVMPILFGTGLLTVVLSVHGTTEPITVPDIRAVLFMLGLGVVGIVLFALYLRLVARWDRATANVEH